MRSIAHLAKRDLAPIGDRALGEPEGVFPTGKALVMMAPHQDRTSHPRVEHVAQEFVGQVRKELLHPR